MKSWDEDDEEQDRDSKPVITFIGDEYFGNQYEDDVQSVTSGMSPYIDFESGATIQKSPDTNHVSIDVSRSRQGATNQRKDYRPESVGSVGATLQKNITALFSPSTRLNNESPMTTKTGPFFSIYYGWYYVSSGIAGNVVRLNDESPYTNLDSTGTPVGMKTSAYQQNYEATGVTWQVVLSSSILAGAGKSVLVSDSNMVFVAGETIYIGGEPCVVITGGYGSCVVNAAVPHAAGSIVTHASGTINGTDMTF